jgi:hypothetical protein
MKAKMIRYKDKNEKIIKAQEKKIELNALLLQSLYQIQKHLYQGLSTSNEGRQ